MTIKMGVIGAGRIGRLHAEHVAHHIPSARLLAISDINEAAARQVAEQLGCTGVSADHKRVLDNPEIDAVLICSSTDTHSRLIEEAARAGKHIFCEKPIDFDLKRIDQALQAVDAAGVKLQIGFNRRFDPNFMHVRQQVIDGGVGQPHLLRITSRDPSPPPLEYVKVSGGLFLDMTIHDFDMARFLAGEEVETVYATGAVRVDPQIGDAGDIDTAVVVLTFKSGLIGTIDNSRKAVYGYDQRVEVFGSAGVAWADNNTPHRTGLGNASGMHAPLPLNFFMERYTQSYLSELNAFVSCIENDTPSPVSGYDGRIPVLMGLAARCSLAEQRPVTLREVDYR